MGQKPADVIKKLMEMGMLLTFNQPIASEAASLLAESFGVRVEMTPSGRPRTSSKKLPRSRASRLSQGPPWYHHGTR